MNKSKGILLILTSAIFWGGTAGLFVSILRDSFGIKELQIIIGRAAFTILFLGLFMVFYDKTLFKIKLKDLWIFAACGIGSIAFFNYCYYKTMALTNFAIAAVLMYTAPIFVMIISLIFFKEKLSFIKVFCCILVVIGVALVSGIVGSAAAFNTKGLIFGLLTGFGYSLYGIISNVLIKRGYSSYTINFYSFVFVLLSVTVLLIRDIPNVISLYTVSYKPILTIALMAIFDTVIPYICYSFGLKSVKPTVAIIIASFEPVVAMIVDIVMGNTPDVFGYIGIAVVLFSVLLLNLKGNETNDSKSKRKDKLNA